MQISTPITVTHHTITTIHWTKVPKYSTLINEIMMDLKPSHDLTRAMVLEKQQENKMELNIINM